MGSLALKSVGRGAQKLLRLLQGAGSTVDSCPTAPTTPSSAWDLRRWADSTAKLPPPVSKCHPRAWEGSLCYNTQHVNLLPLFSGTVPSRAVGTRAQPALQLCTHCSITHSSQKLQEEVWQTQLSSASNTPMPEPYWIRTLNPRECLGLLHVITRLIIVSGVISPSLTAALYRQAWEWLRRFKQGTLPRQGVKRLQVPLLS